MADDFEVGAPPPEESSNRTFLIAAAAIGGLLILSMICLAVYALVLAPRAREARLQEATQIVLENTRVAQALTEEAQGTRVTPTATATRTAQATATSTRTQVVVLATATPGATGAIGGAQTATTAARRTATARALAQVRTPTPRALPSTGLGDDVRVLGLFLAGALLIAIVVVARSIRTTSAD